MKLIRATSKTIKTVSCKCTYTCILCGMQTFIILLTGNDFVALQSYLFSAFSITVLVTIVTIYSK